MKYFRILDDLYQTNRWFLGEVNFDHPFEFWHYVAAGEIKKKIKEDLIISMREKGSPLDFTMADFELLIVNKKTADLFRKEDVQLISVKIQQFESKEQYFILVIKKEFECVDESNSEFLKFAINDPIRPDRAGHYRRITKLIIDESKIEKDVEIFRLKKFDVAVIINENLKRKLESNNTKGIKFREVN
jgi:hypothetical protein